MYVRTVHSRCAKGNTFSISIGATGECIGIDVPVHDPSIPIHQIFFPFNVRNYVTRTFHVSYSL